MRCTEHYRALAFAQLTGRESLRDIEACLAARSAKLYHSGFRAPVRRSTLADANERRDWRIYADFSQRLIVQARARYADKLLAAELDETSYALDSTTLTSNACTQLHQAGAFFVTRAKKNFRFHRLYSAATDHTLGVIADQTVALDGVRTKHHYPDRLRRIRYPGQLPCQQLNTPEVCTKSSVPPD